MLFEFFEQVKHALTKYPDAVITLRRDRVVFTLRRGVRIRETTRSFEEIEAAQFPLVQTLDTIAMRMSE